MNWISLAVKAHNSFFVMIASSIAGSTLVLMLLVIGKISPLRNRRENIYWLKTALILYLIPFASVLVTLSRIGYNGGIVWHSDFFHCITEPMQKIYVIILCIWFLGLAGGIVFRLIQHRKLRYVLKGNIPIEDELLENMVGSYQKKYMWRQTSYYQNDLLDHPIVVGTFSTQIILPLRSYTEKELHMVLEHEHIHAECYDLLWKKLALLVTFIHWWNPFAYILLKKLILQEEIECDIKTCEYNNHFTMKEYGYFLSGMADMEEDMIFVSALCKQKKDLFRRLEGMVKGKKSKKRTVIVSSLILSVLAVLPSYAATETIARETEQWLAQTEISEEVEVIEYKDLETNEMTTVDDEIFEIDLTETEYEQPLSTLVNLDQTIASKTRVIYRWQEMKNGDAIAVIAKCEDSSVTYRIGIKNSAGNMIYKQGTGSINHIFTIDSEGKYSVYVENTSSKSMKVTGSAMYPH